MPRNYTCQGWTANELYDLFNTRYFRGRLPKIPVRWVAPHARERSVIGCTRFRLEEDGVERPYEICIHPRIKNEGAIWVLTLLHEQVHVEQYKVPREQAHGRKFEKRMKQLAQQGAFRGLW